MYLHSLLLIIINLMLTINGQSCTFNFYVLPDDEVYIYNPTYPTNYSGYVNCRWFLRTGGSARVFLTCELNLSQSQNCISDRLFVSPSGNFQSADSVVYCGKYSFSFYSSGTSLAVGLYGTSKGQFVCTAVAMKTTNPEAESVYDERTLNCDCGWKPMNRIIGGVETGVHEFPFMLALIYQKSMWCGGSIISDRFVLTAAHCLVAKTVNDLTLLVGDHDILTGDDTITSAIYYISAWELHPQYDRNTQKNDIALIQTTTQIYFSTDIGPACLPFRYTFQSFAGQNVSLVGWGQTEFGGPQSNVLRKALVHVISNDDCNNKQSETIINGNLCTYSQQVQDACQYDSGGPVVWVDPGSGRYQLLGIISYGVACGVNAPAINTRVTSYLDWIVMRTSAGFCVK